MKTLDEMRRILAKEKGALEREFHVERIGVFGSCAREEQDDDSDVDILVELGAPIGFFEFLDLEERLQKLLGMSVDLVSKKALKPHIGAHILREVVYV